MEKRIKIRLPSKPPEPKPLPRPLLIEKLLKLDLAHEEKRKRYKYDPTLPHLFKDDILWDGRLIGKVYIYLPVEINNIRIKVEEVDPEIS